MTKILHVYGEDYAALNYTELVENGEISPAAMWSDSDNLGIALDYFDSEGSRLFEYEALIYNVDPVFIDFVLFELMDYDATKHASIFVIN